MKKFSIDIKDPKQIVAIAAVTGAILLYVYVALILIPQIRFTLGAHKKASDLRQEVSAAERDIAGIESLKKQAALYRSKIDSYERMLPAEQEVPKLLEDLSEMAKKTGVKIEEITPTQPKDQSGSGQIYQEIPILIRAVSGYHELGAFLAGMESADRFMKVADIEITGSGASPRKHDVVLLVLTYTLPKGNGG